MKVAIISPNQNAYSETFIHAHKSLDAEVFYYYGGWPIPSKLEGYGTLYKKTGILKRLIQKVSRRLNNEVLTLAELAFAKSLKRNKIEVILAEYGNTGAEVVEVCRRFKFPLVAIFHGYDASAIDVIERFKDKYNNLFKYAQKIIVVSNVMYDKLISLGCPASKIIRNTYGPDNKFINVCPTFSESKSFIAVGRFVNKKAPYYTILAIMKVVEKHPDVKLYIAGEGPLIQVSRHLVKYFNLESNIQFLGIVEPETFVEFLTKVTGFIQHSITAENGDMEGTPVAVLEASAAGIPIIATKHGGIPDVIIDGETGLLVEEHDVDGMAEKIITLIENPAIAMKMGQKGKQNIKVNFSMERHLELLKATLSECLIQNKM